MYLEHPTYIQPENENVKVWRYMDFTKFLSLLDSRRLFFTRVDKFDDPFEGSLPTKNVEDLKHQASLMPEEARPQFLVSIFGIYREFKKFAAVSCWHENDGESAAMWKLYLKSEEGIAISTTYKALKSSIIDETEVFMGRIKYIDYETEGFEISNLNNAYLHKRKSFEHEKEIRAIITKPPIPHEGKEHEIDLSAGNETMDYGFPIKVDIEKLIQKIYVAPNAPSWFTDLVKNAVQRYGYNFEVVQSEIYKVPEY